MIAKLKNLVDDCHQCLRKSRIGFNYLSCSRGFSVELIKAEKMGFCDGRIASEFCSSLDENDGVEIDIDYLHSQLVNRVVLPIRADCGMVSLAGRKYYSDAGAILGRRQSAGRRNWRDYR